MDDQKKSEVSKISFLDNLLMGLILLIIFIYNYREAVNFRMESIKHLEIIVWVAGPLMIIRFFFFLTLLIVGYLNRLKFKKEEKEGKGFVPKHIEVAYFGYNLPTQELYHCMNRLVGALVSVYEINGITSTVAAIVTDNKKQGLHDTEIIKSVMNKYNCKGIQMLVHPQNHKGAKRGGFYDALVILSRFSIWANSPVEHLGFYAVDGDSEHSKNFEKDYFLRVFRPLSYERKIGATTVHNRVYVEDEGPWLTAMFQLRFIRRYFSMSAVSNVLTGRGAAFLGIFARDEGFRNRLLRDLINHEDKKIKVFEGNPILSPLKFMAHFVTVILPVARKTFFSSTGDDKSSFYRVVEMGYDVVFNPDVYVVCRENLPKKVGWAPNWWWVQLPMYCVRYMRNTLNNNPRLLAMGIKKLGFLRFVFIFNDAFLFWTPLIGLITNLLLSFSTYGYVHVWISWLILTRTFTTMVVCFVASEPWSPFFPIVLYNDHTTNTLVKLWGFVAPISSWTRQATTEKIDKGTFQSVLSYINILLWLTMTIGITLGIFEIPSVNGILYLFGICSGVFIWRV